MVANVHSVKHAHMKLAKVKHGIKIYNKTAHVHVINLHSS